MSRKRLLAVLAVSLAMLVTVSLVIGQGGGGLNVDVQGVELPEDDMPVVTLALSDSAGNPIDADSLEGHGFTIAQVRVDEETGLSQLWNLLVHEQEGAPYTVGGETIQPALASATQPFADSGGTWAAVGDGIYTYTFANALTEAADPNLTTVLGVYIYKDGRQSVANDVFTFVPAGGEPQVTREIITTEGCNSCHNDLAFHGGTRKEVGLCLTCHTAQNSDPETGNSVDFRQMIHKIHSGAQLPSVQDGMPYMIVGFRQSVHDYSHITWSQDTRNCTTCHTGPDGGNYITAVSAAACTSCHDTVNPLDATNHPGSPKTDAQCVDCHSDTFNELSPFSVEGVHVIPRHAQQAAGVNLELVSVEGAVPGGAPTVTFAVTNNAGEPIAPDAMDYMAITLAGPTSDYTDRVTEVVYRSSADAPSAAVDAGNSQFSYTFTYAIPEDATGSYAFALEGYVMETLDGVADPVRIAGFNPVAYVALDGGEAQERRQVVDRELCNACHQDIALHGTIRQNTQYCVLCHNPVATDVDRRPEVAMPPTTINFRVLIHEIHKGADSATPPVVYGFGGSLHDYSNVVFPGVLNECETCHLEGTYDLPLPRGIQSTTVTQGDAVISTTPPTVSVCSSCHDASAASGHAELQVTSSGVETCEVCHGAGREFDVAKAHD